jgi:hypothetical protein
MSMHQQPDHIERVRKKMFERAKTSRVWWKALSTEEQKKALEAWKAENPKDYRAGWELKLISLTNTVEEIWELSTGTKKDY